MPILFRRNFLRPSQGGRVSETNSPQNIKIVLRKSVFYLILSFIAIELIFDSVYLFVKFPPVIFKFPLNLQTKLIPLYFLLFVILNATKLFLMLTLAIKWISSTYEIRTHEIRHKYGILNKKEKIFLCDLAQEVSLSQNLFGKIFNFGTIEIFNPAIKEVIILEGIPNPEKYAEIVKKNIPSLPPIDFIT